MTRPITPRKGGLISRLAGNAERIRHLEVSRLPDTGGGAGALVAVEWSETATISGGVFPLPIPPLADTGVGVTAGGAPGSFRLPQTGSYRIGVTISMSGSTVDVSSVPTTDLVEVTFGIQTILGVFEIGSMRGSATEWTSGQVLNGVGVILTSLTGTNDLSLTVAANDLTAGGALSIPGTFNCVVIIERT